MTAKHTMEISLRMGITMQDLGATAGTTLEQFLRTAGLDVVDEGSTPSRAFIRVTDTELEVFKSLPATRRLRIVRRTFGNAIAC